MVDTVRSIADLQLLLKDNITGDIDPQAIRDMLVTLAPKFGTLFDTTDQPITSVGVPQTVTFDTEGLLNGFSHVGGEITILETMEAVAFTAEFEVNNGSGSNTLQVWLEGEPAVGGGFVAAPGSGEEVIIPSNSEEVLVLSRIIPSLINGDKIRFRVQGDSTNLSLNSTAASGSVPLIPSTVVNFYKL